MPLDDARRQLTRHPVQPGAAHVVLEPRDRRLRGQGRASHRVSLEKQLVDRVVRQVVGIVAVRMTARDAEDPLPNQVRERVSNLRRRALVGETTGKPLDEAVHALRRLEKDGAAIRARLLAVESGHEGLVEELREQDSL